MEEHVSGRGPTSARRTKELVGMALFAAIVVVLQVFATFVKFGPFSVTLALIPIVVGSAVYGPKAGAWLGFVFSLVVWIMCIVGADVGGAILWSASPLLTTLLCLLKGTMAGWIAGLVYKTFSGFRKYLGVFLAAVASPIVNTGIFCGGMYLFFKDILIEWAGGADIVYYVLVGLVGVNFLLELAINFVLSPIVARIIRVGERL